MRTIMSLLTTVATVMHFSFGCCLHAAHLDGAVGCRHAAAEACQDDACCHGHDGGHDSGGGASHAGRVESEQAREAVAPAEGHACDGCECVGMLEAKPDRDDAASSACPDGMFDIRSVVVSQAARGPCATTARPVPSEVQPPLCGRLLV